jgi:type IV conjugative transfer system protein TraL
MNQERAIYNTLENAPRSLFWEIDDFLSFAVPVFLSIALNSFLCLVLALLSKKLYSRLKKRGSRGSLIHFLYWRLPKNAFFGQLKALPPSCERELLQ